MVRIDGQNVSAVHLTGYLVPEFDDDGDIECFDEDVPPNYFDQEEMEQKLKALNADYFNEEEESQMNDDG